MGPRRTLLAHSNGIENLPSKASRLLSMKPVSPLLIYQKGGEGWMRDGFSELS
jgi:hypothetical protein